jgi:hypothetical protein
MPDARARFVDLVAALGEQVVDLERRVSALEKGAPPPRRITASDLRRIAKALMRESLGVVAGHKRKTDD